jgi:hypothetical protein
MASGDRCCPNLRRSIDGPIKVPVDGGRERRPIKTAGATASGLVPCAAFVVALGAFNCLDEKELERIAKEEALQRLGRDNRGSSGPVSD